MPETRQTPPATPYLVSLDAIDPDALIRDRAVIEPTALEELRNSILVHGLRMPVEIFALAERDGPVV